MSRAFALLMVAIAASLLTILAVSEARPDNAGLPLVRQADFRACTTIHNGPIQRPDHYGTRPHGRKADVA